MCCQLLHHSQSAAQKGRLDWRLSHPVTRVQANFAPEVLQLPSVSAMSSRHATQVWVYEEPETEADEGNLYVHHDVMLPAFPLSVAWLDCDPAQRRERANLAAVGESSARQTLSSVQRAVMLPMVPLSPFAAIVV